MIAAQLPALQVVIPMVAAPVVMLLRWPSLAWLISLGASIAALAVAIALFVQVGEVGVISYAMGGWAPPWGIEYRVDAANAYVLLIVAAVGVETLLAATATKVAVYILLRIFYSLFGVEFSFSVLPMAWILLPLALVGMLSPSLVAIFQDNVKRMLAYSSVAQIGYMILGVSFVSLTGLTAALLHLFNHALMKGALFLALACVVYRVGSASLSRMAGLGQQMPWTMGAFVIGGLSLIGVPLTVGFISKWYLLLAAIERGWWPVAALIVITSLIAAIYIWRVVEVAYFRERPADVKPVSEAPLALLVPTWILTLANIWFGVQTTITVGGAERAALMLIGGG